MGFLFLFPLLTRGPVGARSERTACWERIFALSPTRGMLSIFHEFTQAEPPSSSTLFLQLLISDLPNASIVSAIHDADADAPSPQATGDILS